MYINDMLNMIELESCNVYAFADDIYLLIHGDTSQEIIQVKTNYILDKINEWIASNFLVMKIKLR